MIGKGWTILFIAGLLEVTWAVAMGESNGFTIWYWDIVVVVFLSLSVYLLSKALSEGLPIGVSYAVWTGIGAVGTISFSIIMGTEIASLMKLLFIAMIVIGIAGLQLTSTDSEG